MHRFTVTPETSAPFCIVCSNRLNAIQTAASILNQREIPKTYDNHRRLNLSQAGVATFQGFYDGRLAGETFVVEFNRRYDTQFYVAG